MARGALIYRERFAWHGPWSADDVSWFLGSGRATGSLFLTGTVDGRKEDGLIDRAVLPLESGDSCIRWCGPPRELTANLVGTAMAAAARWHGNDVPWLLFSHHLAPNHWFTPLSS